MKLYFNFQLCLKKKNQEYQVTTFSPNLNFLFIIMIVTITKREREMEIKANEGEKVRNMKKNGEGCVNV